MNYGSVCSGIEAATVAWEPLGWNPVFFSEIEKFPNAVLAQRWPNVKNFGDMTKFKEWPDVSIDLLVGGTPCQSFSVAGLRKGMVDPRGNLALVFLSILDRLRPEWVVWENVPGVLSSNEGRDFASFVGGLGKLGYGWAYRVLDAQYFGVAQRRRRVFVVGNRRDWRRAVAVLFERESLSGNPAPCREAGQRIAPNLETRSGRSGANNFSTSGGLVEISPTLRGQPNSSHRMDSQAYIPCISPALKSRDFKGPSSDGDGDGAPLIAVAGTLTGSGAGSARPGGQGNELDFLVAHPLTAEEGGDDGSGRDVPIIAAPLSAGNNASSNASGRRREDDENLVISVGLGSDPLYAKEIAQPVTARNGDPGVVAFTQNQVGDVLTGDQAPSMGTNQNATGRNTPKAMIGLRVRRLMPFECERLQGFPDNYTLVPYRSKPAADGPRYKALGNSMAVPVMRWIGRRILEVSIS